MDISKLLENLASNASEVDSSMDSLISDLTKTVVVIGKDSCSSVSIFSDSLLKASSNDLTKIDKMIADLADTAQAGPTKCVEPPLSILQSSSSGQTKCVEPPLPAVNGATSPSNSTDGIDTGIHISVTYTTDDFTKTTGVDMKAQFSYIVEIKAPDPTVNGMRFDLTEYSPLTYFSVTLKTLGYDAEIVKADSGYLIRVGNEKIDPCSSDGIKRLSELLGIEISYVGSSSAQINVDPLHQSAKSCGPTSLAMCLSYYNVNTSNFENWFDTSSIGVDPLSLVDTASGYGMVTRQVNHASLEDAAALIDQGLPVMVLGSWGDNSGSLSGYLNMIEKAHYMVVTGYQRDSSGIITNIYLNDPATGGSKTMTADAFMRYWGKEFIPGVTNYLLTFAPQGSVDASQMLGILPTDRVSQSVRDTLGLIEDARQTYEDANNFWNNPGEGISNIIHDFTTIIGDGWNAFWDGVGDFFSSIF